jgi:hypothetical protein
MRLEIQKTGIAAIPEMRIIQAGKGVNPNQIFRLPGEASLNRVVTRKYLPTQHRPKHAPLHNNSLRQPTS